MACEKPRANPPPRCRFSAGPHTRGRGPRRGSPVRRRGTERPGRGHPPHQDAQSGVEVVAGDDHELTGLDAVAGDDAAGVRRTAQARLDPADRECDIVVGLGPLHDVSSRLCGEATRVLARRSGRRTVDEGQEPGHDSDARGRGLRESGLEAGALLASCGRRRTSTARLCLSIRRRTGTVAGMPPSWDWKAQTSRLRPERATKMWVELEVIPVGLLPE